MVRISNLDESLRFYVDALGLVELRRHENKVGRFTLVFLAAPEDETAQVELTYTWDKAPLGGGRNFGHLAYQVKNIYQTCAKLREKGVVINRPPRDGYMAFVKSPDGVSVELLQAGKPLDLAEPWSTMENTGEW